MIVIGGGPAGSLAALAGRQEGRDVRVYEKSAFPRHKVCGEFLSPEAMLVFEKAGVAAGFQDMRPWTVRTANVQIGRTIKRWKLEEPAFGLSRFALDHFLLDQARVAGAEVVRERCELPEKAAAVVARGRYQRAQGTDRTFGFKAHFSGPANDSIDLVFERDFYLGVNCIENGGTNVCGLASEGKLRQFGFAPDELIAAHLASRERLNPLRRTMEWIITGPLVYGGSFHSAPAADLYLAGDSLGFVDPFTGSGMLAAISTGWLAGRNCARRLSPDAHARECGELLRSQYLASTVFRRLIRWGVADWLAWIVPGKELFRLTRPAVDRFF